MERMQGSLECLMRLLGSLSFQVRETEKKKKMVLHALPNKDNAVSIETWLSKELPDSSDCLPVLFELLSFQVEEMEKEEKRIGALLRSLRKKGLFEFLSVQVEKMEKEKKATRDYLRSLRKEKDEVLLALSKMDNATGVVSEKKSDDSVTFFPALLCTDKLPDSIEGLLVLLRSLSVQVKELEKKKEIVLNALKRYEAANIFSEKKSNGRLTIEDAIIVFVNEIEKAIQYFDFEEFLKLHDLVKPGIDKFDVLKSLVCKQKVHERPEFNKLDFKQILDAIEGRTISEDFSDTENDWYTLMWPQKDFDVALVNPILSLVFYIRKKGHVMDKNPLVELSYIINNTFMFYKVCVICRLRKFSEKDVRVFSARKLDEDKIKKVLSFCGDIVAFRERSAPEDREKVAYVTFKESEAAKIAPLFACEKSTLLIEPAVEVCEYQLDETITEYCEALDKYKEFRNYPKKRSN